MARNIITDTSLDGGNGTTRRSFLIGGIAAGTLAVADPAPGQAGADQPTNTATIPTAPQDGTVDTLHGIAVPDPFRPLEDSSRTDVKAWIEAEDTRARGFIDALPVRARVHEYFETALD